MVLNYIVNFQIDYLLCYTPIIVFALAQLVFLLVPHALELFPSKDIFHALFCKDIDQYYDYYVDIFDKICSIITLFCMVSFIIVNLKIHTFYNSFKMIFCFFFMGIFSSIIIVDSIIFAKVFCNILIMVILTLVFNPSMKVFLK